MNRYVYGANNPVRFTDPSGYFAIASYGITAKHIIDQQGAEALSGFVAGLYTGIAVAILDATGICPTGLDEYGNPINHRDMALQMGAYGAIYGMAYGSAMRSAQLAGRFEMIGIYATFAILDLIDSLQDFNKNANLCTAVYLALNVVQVGIIRMGLRGLDIPGYKGQAKYWNKQHA